MSTNAQVLGKFLRGQSLDEFEIQQLERAMDHHDLISQRVAGWSDGDNPRFNKFTSILSPDWQQSPLHSYTFARIADVAVANDTDTYITFDFDAGESKFFAWDTSDKTRIRVLRGGTAFLIVGRITWTANATGYRKLHVEGFDAAAASLGNTALYTAPGSDLVDNVALVNYAAGWRQFPTLAYLKFFVRQTSGGSLDLKDLVLNIFVV